MADTRRHRFCGECGTPLEPGDKFCGGCGTRIPTAAAPEPAHEVTEEAPKDSPPTGGHVDGGPGDSVRGSRDTEPSPEQQFGPLYLPEAAETPDASDPSERERSTVAAPPVKNRRRGWPLAVGGLFIVAALGLGAVGVLASQGGVDLAALGFGTNAASNDSSSSPMSGSSDEADGGSGESDESGFDGDATGQEIAANDPPDPVFDPLVAMLDERTNAPVLLPATMPYEMRHVAIDEDESGYSYGVFSSAEPQEELVESWGRAGTEAVLRVMRESEMVENEYFVAESKEVFEIPDGTTGTLSYMVPVDPTTGTQGPYWQAMFERAGYNYTLSTFGEEPDGEAVREAMSSMVLVHAGDDDPIVAEDDTESYEPTPEPDVSESYEPDPEPAEEEFADTVQQDFFEDYYAAVARQDWTYTYSKLSPDAQSEFTEDEWVAAQEARVASTGDTAPVDIIIEDISGEGGASYTDLRLVHDDGSEDEVTILLGYGDDGEQERYLSDDDVAYLNGLIGGDSTDDTDEFAAVEESIRAHYEAIGAQDFSTAYAYFGPTFRQFNSEESWVAMEEEQGITGSEINDVEVVEVSGDVAQAGVDVTFYDSSGTTDFFLGWELVLEDGIWKLDVVTVGGES